jgi:DNA primase
MRLDNRRYDTAAIRRDYPVEDEIARRGLALRPVGRALLGLCPFHADHNHPNLWVYPDKSYWKCRACGQTGDVIQFVMQFDHLTFGAACDQILGGPSPRSRPAESAPTPRAEPRRWDHLSLDEQTLMNKACVIYHDRLLHTPGALDYLRCRAIPEWVIRECVIGYADGRSLLDCLLTDDERQVAETLGLVRRPARDPASERRYEALAGRIVVPERRAGHTIWFIGRLLEDDGRRPKYLALSGERPVLGLERATNRREVVLCEGVFDFLTALAWRLPAFSPCGTQLPADRLGFLAGAEAVYGALDGDQAGREAAARFSESIGARFRPLRLPAGRDLNDLAQQRGGKRLFFELLTAQRVAGRSSFDAA